MNNESNLFSWITETEESKADRAAYEAHKVREAAGIADFTATAGFKPGTIEWIFIEVVNARIVRSFGLSAPFNWYQMAQDLAGNYYFYCQGCGWELITPKMIADAKCTSANEYFDAMSELHAANPEI